MRMSCRDGAGGARPASDDELQAPYRVLQNRQQFYGGNLLIVLPDTVRHGVVPAARAGLDRGLDRLSSGFRAASIEAAR